MQMQSGSDWRTQAKDIVDARVKGGVCFSSGEVARMLRLSDPSLRFSVLRVGEYIRDLFEAGALPEYNLNGGVYPIYVSRHTADGVEVFVYGPSQADCKSHNFEVDIPEPPGSKQASVLGQIGKAIQDAIDAMAPYAEDPADSSYDEVLAKAQAGLKLIV